MTRIDRQRGITALGLLFVFIVLAFVGYVGLKMFPVYMESLKIDNSMQGLIEDPSVSEMSKLEIMKSLIRRFDINEVDRITERNYADYMTIQKARNKVAITIDYRAEVPLFYNLSLVADFHKHVEN